MNQVINNLKKPTSRKPFPEWRYKEIEISKIANWILELHQWCKLKQYTWIPIPPSSNKSDAYYDDRLIKILRKIQNTEKNLDIRELILTKDSRVPAHEKNGKRLTPEEHIQNFSIDKNIILPTPKAIVIFDDVITTGSTFKAAKKILTEIYTDVDIIGFFVAKSILDV